MSRASFVLLSLFSPSDCPPVFLFLHFDHLPFTLTSFPSLTPPPPPPQHTHQPQTQFPPMHPQTQSPPPAKLPFPTAKLQARAVNEVGEQTSRYLLECSAQPQLAFLGIFYQRTDLENLIRSSGLILLLRSIPLRTHHQ
jgi:hypothetical protein